MIKPEVITKFLKRELDSFEWVKGLSSTQLGAALADAGVTMGDNSLWLHQTAALLLMQHHPRFIFYIGMGGGKTRLMLEALKIRKLRGEKPRAVVFVPYLTAVDTWVEECKKFAPELTCVPLLGDTKENASSLTGEGDLFVICYVSAVCISTWSVFEGFNTLIMDELHKVSNQKTLTFQLCRIISEGASHVYGLTGTPFGKDLQHLWAEFFVIDGGETLGPNISFYRTVFFDRKSNFFGGMSWKFKSKLMPDLRRMIRNKSIHYKITDLHDLPRKKEIIIRVPQATGVQKSIDEAFAELRDAVKIKDRKLVGNLTMRLRQMSSGFLTFQGEDQKERIKVKLENNPKLDALIDLIEQMPPECKMVVFHDFIFTGEIISERLKKEKVKHARIFGGQGKKNLDELNKFRNDENCRVCTINSKAGSSALNLQFANYLVFFECPNVIDREQAEARVWRPGQTKITFLYDLFTYGTVDERYYQSVKAGCDLLDEFLSGRVS